MSVKLSDTYIGKWLMLGRAQSTVATPILLILGYATVSGTIITEDVIGLVVVGMMGHWAIFAHNDLVDIASDLRAGKDHKPLVSGDVGYTEALIAIITAVTLSVIICFVSYGWLVTFIYCIGIAVGIEYNTISKSSPTGPVLLGAWGVVVIFMGSFVGGGPVEVTYYLAFALGLQMFWITMAGDIEDLEHEEESMVKLLGSSVGMVEYNGPEDFGQGSTKFNLISTATRRVCHACLYSQFVLLILVAASRPGIHTVGAAVFSVMAVQQVSEILSTQPRDVGDIKKNIVIQTAFSVSAIIVASGSFIQYEHIAILLLFSVGWNLSVQKLMYGTPVYYP